MWLRATVWRNCLAASLEDAIALAVSAHKGQKDKAGAPYILHPLRLMMAVDSEHQKMAALLHDVVEDCDITLRQLAEWGYPEEVVRAVDHLTRREGETYRQFTERAGRDPIARVVKIADLEDNMNIRRLPSVEKKSLGLLERYHKAWLYLKSLP